LVPELAMYAEGVTPTPRGRTRGAVYSLVPRLLTAQSLALAGKAQVPDAIKVLQSVETEMRAVENAETSAPTASSGDGRQAAALLISHARSSVMTARLQLELTGRTEWRSVLDAARVAEEHLAHANREIGADAAPNVAAIDAIGPTAGAGQAAAMVAAPLIAGLGGLAAPLIVPAIEGLVAAGHAVATPFLAKRARGDVFPARRRKTRGP
jgi:hypothetical protein